MDGGTLSLIMINSYVDFDDYDNVVKTYSDERFFFKLRKGYTKEPDIFIRKNYVTLNDEFFQMGQTEHKEFYSAESSRSDFDLDPTGTIYAKIAIRMEAREDTYERTVFSVFDYTGLIGGVFEILEVLGGLVVGYFIKNWLMFDILSNLYQVQKENGSQNNTGIQNNGNSNSNGNGNGTERHDINEDSDGIPKPLNERFNQPVENEESKEQAEGQDRRQSIMNEEEKQPDYNQRQSIWGEEEKQPIENQTQPIWGEEEKQQIDNQRQPQDDEKSSLQIVNQTLKQLGDDEIFNQYKQGDRSQELQNDMSDEQESGGEPEDDDEEKKSSENDSRNSRHKIQRKNCMGEQSLNFHDSNVQFGRNDDAENETHEDSNTKLKAMLKNRHRYGFSW